MIDKTLAIIIDSQISLIWSQSTYKDDWSYLWDSNIVYRESMVSYT